VSPSQSKSRQPKSNRPQPSQRVVDLQAVLATQPGAVSGTHPATPRVFHYKIAGKTFAILAAQKSEFVMLKCDPHLVEILREQYAGVGHRTHLDRRYWIAIDLDSDVPPDEIARLAAHSHEQVRATLTRKQQAELAALTA